MKFHLKYLAILMLSVHQICFGQFESKDSTKPSRFISFCNDNETKVEKPVQMEWVQKDIGIIKSILNKLPAKSATITGIQQLIPDFLGGRYINPSLTFDLGYGLRSTQYTISGGYGSCYVDALYFGNNVIKLKLTVDNHNDIIEKYLFAEMQLPFACLDGQITYEKTYHENTATYITDSGRLFIESSDTNYRRREAINYFTDILTRGTFAVPYYIVYGLGSETFNNLRYFIVNNDYEALESILFSPSPTSRLFAARTLLYMQQKSGYDPDHKTNERITEVLANAKIICSGILSCWAGRFDYDYFDIVKDFDKLLLTQ